MITKTEDFQVALTRAVASFAAPMTETEIAEAAEGMARTARWIETLTGTSREFLPTGQRRDVALMTAIREMGARGVGDLDWQAEDYFLCSQAVSMVVTEWISEFSASDFQA